MSLSVETLALAKGFAKSYTDSAVAGISGGINYKGAVNYYSDLPNNAKVGDAYTVKYKGSSGTETDGTEYVWASYEGTNQWVAFGPDISQFSKVTANPTLVGTEDSLTGLQVGDTKYKIVSTKIFTNTTVSTWVADETYADFGYRASVALTGVTSDSFAQVVFSVADAMSGNYAPVAETYNGGIYLYSKENTEITVPTIYVLN